MGVGVVALDAHGDAAECSAEVPEIDEHVRTAGRLGEFGEDTFFEDSVDHAAGPLPDRFDLSRLAAAGFVSWHRRRNGSFLDDHGHGVAAVVEGFPLPFGFVLHIQDLARRGSRIKEPLDILVDGDNEEFLDRGTTVHEEWSWNHRNEWQSRGLVYRTRLQSCQCLLVPSSSRAFHRSRFSDAAIAHSLGSLGLTSPPVLFALGPLSHSPLELIGSRRGDLCQRSFKDIDPDSVLIEGNWKWLTMHEIDTHL